MLKFYKLAGAIAASLFLGFAFAILIFPDINTSKLSISDKNGKTIQGVPIASYELWIEEGTYKKLSKGGKCDTDTPFQKVISLATGQTYYITANSTPLGKATLNIKLNTDGALSELSFNSETRLPETLDSAGNALKNLTELGVTGAAAPAADSLPACDSGESIKRVTKYSEWIRAH